MLKTQGQIPPLTVRTPAGQTVRSGDFRQKRNLVIAFLRPGDRFASRWNRDRSLPASASRTAATFDARDTASQVRLAHCEADFFSQLVGRAAELVEREAVALVIFSEPPPATENLPAPIVVAADVSGRAQRAYLGKDAFGPAGQEHVGVFIVDRYGELYAQWVARGADGLPGGGEVLNWLGQTQVAGEECGASHWPLNS